MTSGTSRQLTFAIALCAATAGLFALSTGAPTTERITLQAPALTSPVAILSR